MKYCFSMLTGAFALVAAMHTGTPTVNAAPITVNTAPVENVNCVAFVDEDGDGICDNWNANARRGCGYGKRNGWR